MSKLTRGPQRDCQHEPAYYGLDRPDRVIFSIRFPELTCHLPNPLCAIQEPHLVAECGIWGTA